MNPQQLNDKINGHLGILWNGKFWSSRAGRIGQYGWNPAENIQDTIRACEIAGVSFVIEFDHAIYQAWIAPCQYDKIQENMSPSLALATALAEYLDEKEAK